MRKRLNCIIGYMYKVKFVYNIVLRILSFIHLNLVAKFANIISIQANNRVTMIGLGHTTMCQKCLEYQINI